ncbi:type IV pilus modification PilV family protein [Oligosphaera ethanolica]|uniref:Uncharacterized protein n=1 Tax=Oligosphaera ethanolica TaxID=760260 RepID=A0AAE3VIJ5_9BACT|nr:hypothetical protein [Oligosphaera ethanolica]MDQ0291065.1 hypothetical protein [Oligosphaera ethanolica]
MKRKHPFNMIEIMLALGVCAIGITSIMVLFPVGSAATRDAAMETYAAHAADQMLHMLKYKMITSWDTGIVPATNPQDDSITTGAGWGGAEPEMDTIFKHSTASGVYQVISDRGTTPSLTSENIDFRSIMFVWLTDISIVGNQNIGITLNIEVTWPAELPYASRQKGYYSLEVFNPNYVAP